MMQSCGLQGTHTHPTLTRKEGTGNKYPGASHSVHSWRLLLGQVPEAAGGRQVADLCSDTVQGRKSHRESRIQRGLGNRARAETTGEVMGSEGIEPGQRGQAR